MDAEHGQRRVRQGAVPRPTLLRLLARVGIGIETPKLRRRVPIVLVGPTGTRITLPKESLRPAEIRRLLDQLGVDLTSFHTDRHEEPGTPAKLKPAE